MSEDEPADPEAEEADAEEVDAEEQPETTDGQPSLDDSEQADLSGIGDVDPEEIEDDAGASGDGADDGTDAESEESDSADAGGSEDTTEMEPAASAGEWGEMYVSICQTTTNAILEKHGDGEKVEKEHFTDTVPLDEYFNQTMQEMVGDSEMPPQQALVVGTALAVGGPVAMHTELLEEMAGNIDADALGGGAA